MHPASRPPERRPYLADAMLGDVARWLRIMGEDCVYADPKWSDDEVLARAAEDDRVVVTRDAHLSVRGKKAALHTIMVPQGDIVDALVAVYAATDTRPARNRLATRCAACNGPLTRIDGTGAAARAAAEGKEPPKPRVLERHERFWTCDACAQPYWRGTHWEGIEQTLDAVLARLG